MFKMLLVGYLYGIKSERRLVQEVQLNIAYRWFCGFELADKIPDHSTFSKTRLRKWNESQLFQQVFLEIIRRCVKNGLIDGKELKIRVESYNFQPESLFVNKSNPRHYCRENPVSLFHRYRILFFCQLKFYTNTGPLFVPYREL